MNADICSSNIPYAKIFRLLSIWSRRFGCDGETVDVVDGKNSSTNKPRTSKCGTEKNLDSDDQQIQMEPRAFLEEQSEKRFSQTVIEVNVHKLRNQCLE